MSEQFATAADFRKTYKSKSFEMIDGRRVKIKALTPLDIINIQKDVLDAALTAKGVKDLDDVATRQGYCESLSDGQMTEFMLEVARRVIVLALVAPQFTMLEVGPESEKVHISELTPSDIMDLYLEIEHFSGIERKALATLRAAHNEAAIAAKNLTANAEGAPDPDEAATEDAPDPDGAVTEDAGDSPDTVLDTSHTDTSDAK